METDLHQAITASGLRMTRQRQVILDVLRQSHGHLDAEALHDRVRQQDPRISLATVYRTLALLKEFGLVQEHRLGEEHGHFEAAPQAPHYHFTCLKCRKVIEFQASSVQRVVREVAAKESVQITDVHLLLSGYCADCSREGVEGNHET